MGDRCSMTLEIGGHVATRRALDKIIDALIEDGADGGFGLYEADDFRGYLIKCAKAGETPEFDFDEVNYARLDAIDVLAKLGMDVVAHNGAGCDYGEGYQTRNGLTGESYEWEEYEDSSISIESLEKALAGPDPVDAIRAMIDTVKAEQWVAIRPFTMAPELIRELESPVPPAPGTAHLLALAKL